MYFLLPGLGLGKRKLKGAQEGSAMAFADTNMLRSWRSSLSFRGGTRAPGLTGWDGLEPKYHVWAPEGMWETQTECCFSLFWRVHASWAYLCTISRVWKKIWKELRVCTDPCRPKSMPLTPTPKGTGRVGLQPVLYLLCLYSPQASALGSYRHCVYKYPRSLFLSMRPRIRSVSVKSPAM